MKSSETGRAVEQASNRSSQETGRASRENPKRRRLLVVIAVTAAFAAAAFGMVTALAAPSSADDSDRSAPGAEGAQEESGDEALWAEDPAEEMGALFLAASMGPPLEIEIEVLTEDLDTVLSPLVDDGTINQTQLDAVIAAIVASVRDEHQAMVDCLGELQALDTEALQALKEGNSALPEGCAAIFGELPGKTDFLSKH